MATHATSHGLHRAGAFWYTDQGLPVIEYGPVNEASPALVGLLRAGLSGGQDVRVEQRMLEVDDPGSSLPTQVVDDLSSALAAPRHRFRARGRLLLDTGPFAITRRRLAEALQEQFGQRDRTAVWEGLGTTVVCTVPKTPGRLATRTTWAIYPGSRIAYWRAAIVALCGGDRDYRRMAATRQTGLWEDALEFLVGQDLFVLIYTSTPLHSLGEGVTDSPKPESSPWHGTSLGR